MGRFPGKKALPFMNLLYLTFQEDAPLYLGVTRKIRGQAAAFQKLGYEVTYTLWQGKTFRFCGADSHEAQIGPGRVMKQFFQIAEEYVSARRFDVLYLRLDRISFDVLHLCRAARKAGTRRIGIEIPNYPYLKDYARNIQYAKGAKARAVTAVKIAATAAADRFSGLSLRGLVDGVVLYGNHAERFFGVKAMNADNGIDTESIPVVPPRQEGSPITMLGVAGTLWWQGYDRVLEGMRAYRAAGGSRLLRFVLVGGDRTEMPDFLKRVEDLGLRDDVLCPGFQTGDELNRTYQTADVGISTLGCYRRGLTRCSSLKAREYAAAGLPFLYAYDDDSLRGDEPFALRIPNNETPVDMETLVTFVDRCRRDSACSVRERRFAEEQYDWKAMMRCILTFLGE